MCDAMHTRQGGLLDEWKVDVGAVDTIEGIGEDAERNGQRDLCQLGVGVAGCTDSSELVLADRAARGMQAGYEAHQGITPGVTRGLLRTNGAQRIDRQFPRSCARPHKPRNRSSR